MNYDKLIESAQARRRKYLAKYDELRELASENKRNKMGLEYLNESQWYWDAANAAWWHIQTRKKMKGEALRKLLD